MTHANALQRAATHLDNLLNVPRQVWLLGAGISKDAGIPLMFPLTARVEQLLESQENELGVQTSRSAKVYEKIFGQLSDGCHIEHVLTHIGDLISVAERKKDKVVTFGKERISADELDIAPAAVESCVAAP